VTRGRSLYLPKTLVALAGQDAPPDAVVLVDAGPHADPAIAEMAMRCGIPREKLSVVHAVRAKNFGQAVAAGLSGRLTVGPIWLLHDDCRPQASCLRLLAAALELAPSAGLVGPKQVRADNPALLGEVGVTTTPLGRRAPFGHDGELDQGQFDGLEDVLAVGSAGMLIRPEAWLSLGGFTPALGPFRDGLDISRRARLAGYRVMVEPAARLEHEQATYRGLRATSTGRRGARQARVASTERSYRARRSAWVFTLLAGASMAAVVPLAVMAVVLGFGRFVWRIARKEFRLAVDELAAPLAVVFRPDGWLRARHLARRTRRAPRRSLAPLLVSAREARVARRDRRVTEADRRRRALAPTEIEIAEHRELGTRRRRMATAVFTLALVLTGAALYRLVGPGTVTGGPLGPQERSVWELLRLAGGGWQGVGLGEAGPADPFSAVWALVTALCFGDGAAAVKLVAIGAPLAAAAGAWFAAGAASRSTWIRAWAAICWVASPALWTALSAGRLGPAVTHAALPWVFLGVARAIGANRLDVRPAVFEGEAAREAPLSVGSTAAAAAAGLVFALAAAGSPVLLPLGLVAVLVTMLFAGRGRRLRLTWVALPGLALFSPVLWSVAHGGAWRQLLADPGPVVPYEPAPLLLRLAGWSETPVLPSFLDAGWAEPLGVAVVAGALVAAVIALTRRGRQARGARLGWVAALLGGVGVLATGHLAVSVKALEPSLAWSGGSASLVLAGLLAAGAIGLTGLVGEAGAGVGARRFRLVGASVGLVALLAAPLAAGVYAVWARWNLSDVHRVGTAAVPPLAADGATGPRGVYTLVLTRVAPGQAEEALVWEVSRGSGRQVSDSLGLISARTIDGLPGAITAPDLAERAMNETVAAIWARNPGAAALDLGESGVGFVLAGRDDLELAAALDATPGLTRATETDLKVVWQVATDGLEIDQRTQDLPSRLHVVLDGAATALECGPDSTISTELPEGPPGRVLVLAERAGQGWRATLDGQPLAAVSAGQWEQVFELPAGGGQLRIWHRDPWEFWAAQALVFVLAALVALPTRRAARDREDS
jgi:GT2 family glycosyltransferase